MAEMGYRTGVLDLTAGDMGTPERTPEIRVKESGSCRRSKDAIVLARQYAVAGRAARKSP